MKAKDERERLENMLDNSPDNLDDCSMNDASEISQDPVLDIDFDDMRATCDEEARVMLNNSIGVFLDEEMKKDEYVKNKLEVDIISLSGMIYQLRVNEEMQKAVMKEVNKGMVNPRMFEVFSGMSRTIGELNKQLLATVEAIKTTYKSLRMDFMDKRNELETRKTAPELAQGDTTVLKTADGSFFTLGTKDMIKEMQSKKGKQIIEEEIIDVNDMEV